MRIKDGQAGADLEITPAMIEAGVQELRELRVGEADLGRMVSEIYRAMELERLGV